MRQRGGNCEEPRSPAIRWALLNLLSSGKQGPHYKRYPLDRHDFSQIHAGTEQADPVRTFGSATECLPVRFCRAAKLQSSRGMSPDQAQESKSGRLHVAGLVAHGGTAVEGGKG